METHPFDTTDPDQLTEYFTWLANIVNELLPPKTLFCLVTFGYGDPANTGQYVSNGTRQDVIRELRRLADLMESGKDVPR